VKEKYGSHFPVPKNPKSPKRQKSPRYLGLNYGAVEIPHEFTAHRNMSKRTLSTSSTSGGRTKRARTEQQMPSSGEEGDDERTITYEESDDTDGGDDVPQPPPPSVGDFDDPAVYLVSRERRQR